VRFPEKDLVYTAKLNDGSKQAEEHGNSQLCTNRLTTWIKALLAGSIFYSLGKHFTHMQLSHSLEIAPKLQSILLHQTFFSTFLLILSSQYV